MHPCVQFSATWNRTSLVVLPIVMPRYVCPMMDKPLSLLLAVIIVSFLGTNDGQPNSLNCAIVMMLLVDPESIRHVKLISVPDIGTSINGLMSSAAMAQIAATVMAPAIAWAVEIDAHWCVFV